MTKKRKKKRRMEFSKKVVIWTIVTMVICIGASFLLAANRLESCYEVTTGVITFGSTIIITQMGKSLGEKHSRNKYGLDKNGNKVVYEPEESTEDTICG